MRITKTTIAALSLALMGCAGNEYDVKGSSALLSDGDTVYLTTDLWSYLPMDTAVVSEGEFAFEGMADSLRLAMIVCPAKPQLDMPFVLEGGSIRLRLSDMPMQSRASGTTNNRRWQRFMDRTLPIGLAIDSIAKRIDSGHMDSAQQRQAMAHIESLDSQFDSIAWATADQYADKAFGRLIRREYSKPENQE